MMLMPLVYVSDVDASVAFYERLGLAQKTRSRSGEWAELEAGGAILALHHSHGLPGMGDRVNLSFVADEPLGQVEARLRRDGVEVTRPVTDEAFGYLMEVRDPDGLLIQINAHDPDLYT